VSIPREYSQLRIVIGLLEESRRANHEPPGARPKAARGLDKALFAKLATGDWIGRRHDLLITGKTGTGKSWLACALGHKACRDDRSVLYYRVPRLLDALALARGTSTKTSQPNGETGA
jgi:DNA replication protein DnaC